MPWPRRFDAVTTPHQRGGHGRRTRHDPDAIASAKAWFSLALTAISGIAAGSFSVGLVGPIARRILVILVAFIGIGVKGATVLAGVVVTTAIGVVVVVAVVAIRRVLVALAVRARALVRHLRVLV